MKWVTGGTTSKNQGDQLIAVKDIRETSRNFVLAAVTLVEPNDGALSLADDGVHDAARSQIENERVEAFRIERWELLTVTDDDEFGLREGDEDGQNSGWW